MASASLLPVPSLEGSEVPHPVPHQLAESTWDQPGSRGRSAAATACRRGPAGTREYAGPQPPHLKTGRARALVGRILPLRFTVHDLALSTRWSLGWRGALDLLSKPH